MLSDTTWTILYLLVLIITGSSAFVLVFTSDSSWKKWSFVDLFPFAGLKAPLALNSNTAGLNLLSLCLPNSSGLASAFICFHIWVPLSAAVKDYHVFFPADLS